MFFHNEDIKWWFGFVEESSTPSKAKVRILSVNNIDPELVPTEDLREAKIATSTHNSGFNGLGTSTSHLWEGACVMGVSLDKEFSKLIILHTITSEDEICAVALGQEDVLTQFIKDNAAKATGSGTSFTEPTIDHTKVVYPYNKATVTRSGHVIEIDDTPEQERLQWSHRTGSYSLMNYDGDYVQKATKDFYQIINRDFDQLISGHGRFVVKGSRSERVSGVMYYSSPTWQLEAKDILLSAASIEMHANVTITGNLDVVQTLTVGTLQAGSIVCNSLSCASMIEGSVPFATQAGSLGGSVVLGSSAGSPQNGTMKSTGGKSTDGAGVPELNPSFLAPSRKWDTVAEKFGPLKKMLKNAFKNRSDLE